MSAQETAVPILTPTGTVNAENPWPGLLSFRETDQQYFQGRRAETEDLFRMVMRERLVVLFGLSGLGKSSLLQAGLFPPLRPQRVLPVYIRLDFAAETPDLVKQILHLVIRNASDHQIEAPRPIDGETLWEYFHREGNNFWNERNRPVMPLLVFDQFEEIFTVGRLDPVRAAATECLIEQLADMAEGRPPAALKARLDQHPDEAAVFQFERQHYKILLSIREDFLPDLESLRPRMPALALNRLRLRRMNGDAALHVVSQAKHLIDPDVARQVVRFVAADHGGSASLADLEVEPALLSVVCRELNNKRLNLGEDRITAGLLEGSQQQVLSDFYERSTADLPPQVRFFIEEHLLTHSGYRDSVALENALNVPGISRLCIDELVERRLIRREDRGGVQRLELTHDLLAGVVRASRDSRRLKEEAENERLALIRAQQEQQQALLEAREREQQELQRAQERQAARRSRAAAAVFLVLMLFAATAAVWAWSAQREAERLRSEALEQRAKAVREADDAQRARVYAEEQKSAAEAAQEESAASAVVSSSRELATAALLNLTSDPELSILLALAAVDRSETAEASDVLHRALHAARARFDLPFSVEEHQLTGPETEISADMTGSHIAILAGGKLTAWDLSAPAPKRSQKVLSQFQHAAAFTRDGRTLAIAARGAGIKLWSVPELRLLAELMPEEDQFEEYQKLAFSPDGRFLAVSRCGNVHRNLCPGAVIDVWDIPARKQIGKNRPGIPGEVYALAWSPELALAAAGAKNISSIDGQIAVWKNAIQESPPVLFVDRELGSLNGVAFSLVGKTLRLLYSAPRGNDVQVLEAASGFKMARWAGHTGGLRALAQSADGFLIASAGADRTARIWDSRSDQERLTLRGHKEEVRRVAFSADGKRLATLAPDGVKVWNVAANGEVASWSDPAGASTLLGLGGDGRLITVRQNAGLSIIDLFSSTSRTIPGPFDHAVISRDGRWLAHSHFNTVVTIEDQNSGKKVPSPNQPDGFLFHLEFSGNGQRLLMITDGAPRVWDLATARYLNRPAGADKIGVTGTISDDGRVVVFNTEDRDDVTAWNVETGHVAKMTPGANDNARFALNPTGRLLAGSAPDGRIVIWDSTSGRIVRYIPGHAGPATALVFSADGKLLASGGADKITRIWDVATGQENLSLPGHFEPVNKILFSRDGQRLTTATRQGETLVYALDLKDLVAVARSRVTRAMTPEECRKFLHMESCSANPSRIARSEPTGARHLKRWNARGYVSGPRRGSFTEE